MRREKLLPVAALAVLLALPATSRASEPFWGALFGAGAGALLGKAIGGDHAAVVGGLLGAAVGASSSARGDVAVHGYASVPVAPGAGYGVGYGVGYGPVVPAQPYTWAYPAPPVVYAPPVVVGPPVVYAPPRVYAPAYAHTPRVYVPAYVHTPRVIVTPPPVYVRPRHAPAPSVHYHVYPGGAQVERARAPREYRRSDGYQRGDGYRGGYVRG